MATRATKENNWGTWPARLTLAVLALGTVWGAAVFAATLAEVVPEVKDLRGRVTRVEQWQAREDMRRELKEELRPKIEAEVRAELEDEKR